jgi:hypothetical protein
VKPVNWSLDTKDNALFGCIKNGGSKGSGSGKEELKALVKWNS